MVRGKLSRLARSILLLLLGLCCFAEIAAAVAWPLRVGGDGRTIEDQNGVRFTLAGDAAWELTTDASASDVLLYLDNLAAQMGNAALVRLVDQTYPGGSDANRNGDRPWGDNNPVPFMTYEDPSAAPYWLWIDGVVQAARLRGIVLLFAPYYVGFNCQNGWGPQTSRTTQEMREYGEFLGGRYASFGNIMWVHGGDTNVLTTCPAGTLDRVHAVADGIRATWPDSLHTAHAGRGTRAAEVHSAVVDIDSTYSRCSTIGDVSDFPQQGRDGYDTNMPFFAIEGFYEDRPNQDPSDECLRAQFWWAALGGGFGGVSGHESIWCFDGVGVPTLCDFTATGPPWTDHVGYPGTAHFPLAQDILASYGALAPDYNHDVLTAGFGSIGDSTYAAAASSALATVVYTPDQRTLTLDFSNYAAVDARWVEASGESEVQIGSLIGAGHQLTPPAPGDWLLVAIPEPHRSLGLAAGCAGLLVLRSATRSGTNKKRGADH